MTPRGSAGAPLESSPPRSACGGAPGSSRARPWESTGGRSLALLVGPSLRGRLSPSPGARSCRRRSARARPPRRPGTSAGPDPGRAPPGSGDPEPQACAAPAGPAAPPRRADSPPKQGRLPTPARLSPSPPQRAWSGTGRSAVTQAGRRRVSPPVQVSKGRPGGEGSAEPESWGPARSRPPRTPGPAVVPVRLWSRSAHSAAATRPAESSPGQDGTPKAPQEPRARKDALDGQCPGSRARGCPGHGS